MISNKSFFNNSKVLPIDQFIENVLYNKKVGYYSSKTPFGKKGDFLTAPGISNLFSEIIGIWLISTWHTLDRPKNFNIVELGPGDGSLTKILLKIFQKFSTFNQATNIFLYEKSNLLRKLQKKFHSEAKVILLQRQQFQIYFLKSSQYGLFLFGKNLENQKLSIL